MNAVRGDARTQSRATYVHATAVAIAEAGILIRGASGAGKSRLALSLIAAAEPLQIFTRLIGDDRILLTECGGRLIARGHPQIEGQIERRGEGILNFPVLTAAVVRLLVELSPAGKEPPRYPDLDIDHAVLENVAISRLSLRQEAAGFDAATQILHRLGWGRKSLSRHRFQP